MNTPQLLHQNDKVIIIAASKSVNQGDVARARECYKAWGLQVEYGQHIFATHHQQAGTDEQRLFDLQHALDAPEIKAVVFARGGYGLTRILDRLDFSKFVRHPKWLCGFSDITALLAKINNLGIEGLHAPMPMFHNLGLTDRSIEAFHSVLFEGRCEYEINADELNVEGTATGRLVGGNLSMICNSMGTSSEIDTEGNILFLEDLTEYYYHVDRMMVQLDRAGKLEHLSGLMVGHFSKLQDNEPPFGKSANEIMLEHCGKYGYPIAFNFPVGHEPENFTLICGRKSELKITGQSVMLKQ